jgi:hypothetical protein
MLAHVKREKENKRNEFIAPLVIAVFVVLVAIFIGIQLAKFDEKKQQRIAATKFQVFGVIEQVREVFHDSSFSGAKDTFIIIQGIEYEVARSLVNKNLVVKGEEVTVSGQEGRINTLSVIR